VNSSSHSVNGDIVIQWEWSNFDPSQNPNPLTDYDKTLHNWLRPRDEHETQTLGQSTVRERLGKYVKHIFFYSDLFFPDSPTEVTRAWNFTHDGSKHALWRKEVPFGGPHNGRQHFGVQIPQKPSKWPSTSMFERPRTQDEWRHTRLTSLACSRSAVERRILFIASWNYCSCVFYNIYNATIVSTGALYSVRKFSFCKIYTVFCKQSVLQIGA